MSISPEITVYENSDDYVEFRPFTYGRDWSDETKIGEAAVQADFTRIYFYVKESDSDEDPWLALTDASASQIEWLSDGIRIKFGSNTNGHSGDDQVYELRVKTTGGRYITLRKGRFNVIESTVDRP